MNDLKKKIKPIDLARQMGIPQSTVYSWKRIPRWREDAVLKALEELNKKEKEGK